MRDIFPLNYCFLNCVLCPTVNSQVCREDVGKLLVVTSTRSTLFRQYWADLFYTYEITEIKAILLDDSGGFLLLFFVVLLILIFFLFAFLSLFVADLGAIWEPLELYGSARGHSSAVKGAVLTRSGFLVGFQSSQTRNGAELVSGMGRQRRSERSGMI